MQAASDAVEHQPDCLPWASKVIKARAMQIRFTDWKDRVIDLNAAKVGGRTTS